MATVIASFKEPSGKRYAVTGIRLVDRHPETGEFVTERVTLYEDDDLEIARLAYEMYLDQTWRKAQLIDRNNS